MRTLKLPLLAMASAMIALPAAAQEAAPAPSQGTAPTTSAPAQGTAPAAGATASAGPVSDAEVDKFATAVVAVDKINKDTSVAAAEKQPQMASAVTSSGLTPERFNTIATAMNTDSALQAKVGKAIQAKAPAAPAGGAAPGTGGAPGAADPMGGAGATPPAGSTPGTPPQGGM